MSSNAAATTRPLPYLDENGRLTELARKQLNNPFDPADVTFKPTDIKEKNGKKTGLALAYADKRTYEERLDEVFGAENWEVTFTHVTTSPYRKVKAAKRKDWKDPQSEIIEPESVTEGHRVMVVIRVDVRGLAHKESSGVSTGEDENSITTAEAQAFKRACSMLGIGKYFYSLPRFEVEISYGKIKDMPKLPDSATPEVFCTDCTKGIHSTSFKDAKENVNTWSKQEIIARSKQHFQVPLCVECMKTRRNATTSPEAKKRVQGATSTEQTAAAA